MPVALALVHTTYSGKTYNNAACDLTYSTSSTTETVSQSIGLNGQSGTAEQDTVGSGWSASGGAGSNVGLSLMYPFTGTINDSALTSSNLMSSSYVDGSDYGSSSGPYTTTEWMSAPTVQSEHRASGRVGIRKPPEREPTDSDSLPVRELQFHKRV